jgi:signal transduction histidine kinase
MNPLHATVETPVGSDVEELTRELIEEHRKRENEQHFLSDASVVLAASLDYETTLASIARVVVPYLADCSVVDVVERDGSIRRASVYHRNVDRERLLWALDPFNEPGGVFGRGKVLRTGRPEIYSTVSRDLESAIARTPRHLGILRLLGFKSYMCAPMKTRGQIRGAIGFMRQAGSESYTASDLALAQNLADRAALALDNASLYRREQEANQLKDNFLATVSHEIRSPLTPILGAVYMLRLKEQAYPELAPMFRILEGNAKREAQIVEDLLDISKIANGKFKLVKRRADVLPAIETAANLIRPAAEALGIRFVVDLAPPNQTLDCDPARIQQALTHLLSNSIKFTGRGGRIELRLQNRANGIRLTIADTGTGISPEFLPHVFDSFRQAGRFMTRSHAGLGVGLSIVRHIVEAHGGRVHAESAGVGRGAVFTIDLPY